MTSKNTSQEKKENWCRSYQLEKKKVKKKEENINHKNEKFINYDETMRDRI